jgi:VanZ family protein
MHFISNHGRTWLRWLPALFFAVTIFMFSSTPGKEVDDSLKKLTTTVKAITPAVSYSHTPASPPKIDWLKLGHGIGYFCLGVTVLYALTIRSRWSLLTALMICSLYAVTDELHQAFTPGRSAAGRDVLLDSLAALAGILILFGIVKWRTRRKFREVQTRSG